MRVEDAAPPTFSTQPVRRARSGGIVLGIVLGGLGTVIVGAVIVGPLVLSKRNDLPLERIYGDFAFSVISRAFGDSQQNPAANDRRALAAGREAYTGSCGV